MLIWVSKEASGLVDCISIKIGCDNPIFVNNVKMFIVNVEPNFTEKRPCVVPSGIDEILLVSVWDLIASWTKL